MEILPKIAMNASDIKAAKGKGKLTCLTAYTAPMAQILAQHVDMILVGDSVGMVLHGMDNTLGVTLDMMAMHGRAVTRGVQAGDCGAFVIIDMPYGTYEGGADLALKNARYLIDQTQGQAVKLEGGQDMQAQIAAITGAGIDVMGHIGLQPQSVEKEGGYKIKGRTDADIERLIADAKAIEAAGVFAMVVEGTVPEAAEAVTSAVSVPVIGIGASVQCDGQVLVTDDMLGMHTGHVPKFVKQYASLARDVSAGAASFAAEVRAQAFPADEHLYKLKKLKKA